MAERPVPSRAARHGARGRGPQGPRRGWGWLVVIVAFAVYALAGPVVIARRQGVTLGLGSKGGGTSATATQATVDMSGLAFHPTTLTVRKGTRVLFTNHDVAPHTVTALDGKVDSGVIDPGRSFSLVLSSNFRYRCTIHPSMTASVVVAT